MLLRRLPETLINQIAAGEVVERPAAVVKELIENAIDAGAKNIDTLITGGGQNLVSVSDNGFGMSAKELSLAVQRHVTSKLPDNDLIDIKFLGFRGEALPSISAVSRLKLSSRQRNAADAWSIQIDSGIIGKPHPEALSKGTKIEVRDLFYNIPARLKFLKSPKTEQSRIVQIIKRIAMANCNITFTLSDERRKILDMRCDYSEQINPSLNRLKMIIGEEFAENSIQVQSERDGIKLTGYAGLPTLNRGNSAMQYLFVNSRPVNDRMLFGALRGAYRDLLASNRYPLVALFLHVPPHLVDVNVHPAKTEVRFQDQGIVRGLIVSSIKFALSQAGHRTSSTVSEAALGAMKRASSFPIQNVKQGNGFPFSKNSFHGHNPLLDELESLASILPNLITEPSAPNFSSEMPDNNIEKPIEFPLGAARAQLHETYIVAQSHDSIILVDQHAAHERLVEEKIKKSLSEGGVKRQGLLIPEIIELNAEDCSRLLSRSDELKELGLIIEGFGQNTVIVREIPTLLKKLNLKGLLHDLADDILSCGEIHALKDRIGEVCATMACHGSVRAGRRLNVEEMNSLLREMEETPNSGQCSHGRPTYIELKLSEIEKLFGRR